VTHYEFSAAYSEAMVRKAVHLFFWHRLKPMWMLFVVMALLTAVTVTLVALGDRSWVIGLFAAGLGFSVVWLVFLYRAHLNNAVGRLKQMKGPRAEFRLQDESITVTSELGSATLPWSTIQEILESSTFWVLCTSPNQFFTLPIAEVPAAALDFIRSRAGHRSTRF
jgi:hypothetical protein